MKSLHLRGAAIFVLIFGVMAPGTSLAVSDAPPGASTGDAAAYIAGLALEVDVREHTGTAAVRFPIEVPPGRNGLHPNLTLVYSHYAGHGPLGAGWRLPIGRIQRSMRRGVPRYRDADPDPDANDIFVVLLPEAGFELVPLGGNEYAARIDEFHMRVTADPAGNAWRVRDKSGLVYSFGTAAEAGVGPDTSSFSQTFAWHLTRVEDTNGNTMDFSYGQPGDGHVYPASIAYGGHVSGLAHKYSVSFLFEEQAGVVPRISYAAGFRREARRQLTSIQVRTFDGSQGIRTYQLRWNVSPVNGAALLEDIELIGSDDITPLSNASGAPAATRFDYYPVLPPDHPGDPDFAALRSEALGIQSIRDSDECRNRDFIDVNGDGRADLIRTGAWTAANPFWTVRLNQGTDAASLFGPPLAWRAPAGCIVRWTPGPPVTPFSFNTGVATRKALIDLDGDGIREYVDADVPNIGDPWKVYFREGNGFATQPVLWTLPPLGGGFAKLTQYYPSIQELQPDELGWSVPIDLIDLNGDGRPDLVDVIVWNDSEFDFDHWAVFWNEGAGFAQDPELIPVPRSAITTSLVNWIREGAGGQPTHNIDIDVFDVNGDGLPDRVEAQKDSPGNFHWDVWYGTGHGFSGVGGTEIPHRWDGVPRSRIRRWNDDRYVYDVFDLNGDRLPDFVRANNWSSTNPTWIVHRNTGQGFAPGEAWYAPTALRKKTSDQQAFVTDSFDLDGNGYPDIVKFTATTAKIWLRHPRAYRPDTLSVMTNPLGGLTSVEYDVSTTFDDAEVDPQLDDGDSHLAFPVWVVASVLKWDGRSRPEGEVLTRYRYGGGYYDAVRRSFRGFHRVEKSDVYGMTELTHYEQREALVGKPSVTSLHAGPPEAEEATVMRSTEFAWSCGAVTCESPNDPYQRFFPVRTEVRRKLYSSLASPSGWLTDLGDFREAVTSYEYGACGNVVHESKSDPSAAPDPTEIVTLTEYADLGGGCNVDNVCVGICDRPVQVTNVNDDRVESFEYDGAGNLTRSVQLGEGNPTTTRSYDAFGNLRTLVDPRDTVTTIEYDAATQIHAASEVRDANGVRHTTTTTYDVRFGRATSRTELSGAQTQWAYDVFGRLHKIAEPGQTLEEPTRELRYALDVNGISRVDTLHLEPNRVASPPYLTESAFYDALGRPLQRQRARRSGFSEGFVVMDALSYGAGGRVLKEYAPFWAPGDPSVWLPVPSESPAVVLVHDEFGRIRQRTSADGDVVGISYDRARIERRCHVRQFAFEPFGRCLEEERDGFGRLAQRRWYEGTDQGHVLHASEMRTYNASDQVMRIRRNGEPLTDVVTQYDILGRKIRFEDPDSGVWRFAYDAGGNLVYRDDPRLDQHLEFEYDALNRLSQRREHSGDEPGGAVRTTQIHLYGGPAGLGRLWGIIDASGETFFEAYDERGNPLRIVKRIRFGDEEKSFTTTRTYDAIGRLETTTLPYPDEDGVEVLTYEYSEEGDLERVASSEAVYVDPLEYDPLGRVVGITYGNGIFDRFDYHGATGDPQFGGGGQALREIRTFDRFEATLRHLEYTDYDRYGQITQIEDRAYSAASPLYRWQVFAYDSLSRLVGFRHSFGLVNGEEAFEFAHDALGNLTAKNGRSYLYEDPTRPHQVTRVDSEMIRYDANGNMVELPGGRTLDYDAEDRLREVRRDGAVIATYLYDYAGRRVASATPGGTTLYFGAFDVRDDGEVERHIRAGERLIAASIVLEEGTAIESSSSPLPPVGCVPPPSPSARTFSLHLDHLGGPQLLTDEEGNVLEHLAYHPYGELQVFDGNGAALSGSVSAFLFTGQRSDDGTGLYYFGARYYDFDLGLFVTHDPERQFPSPYSYGNGNPANGRDASGRFFATVGAASPVGVGGVAPSGIGVSFSGIVSAPSSTPSTGAALAFIGAGTVLVVAGPSVLASVPALALASQLGLQILPAPTLVSAAALTRSGLLLSPLGVSTRMALANGQTVGTLTKGGAVFLLAGTTAGEVAKLMVAANLGNLPSGGLGAEPGPTTDRAATQGKATSNLVVVVGGSRSPRGGTEAASAQEASTFYGGSVPGSMAPAAGCAPVVVLNDGSDLGWPWLGVLMLLQLGLGLHILRRRRAREAPVREQRAEGT